MFILIPIIGAPLAAVTALYGMFVLATTGAIGGVLLGAGLLALAF
jgi:hypothetical protein